MGDVPGRDPDPSQAEVAPSEGGIYISDEVIACPLKEEATQGGDLLLSQVLQASGIPIDGTGIIADGHKGSAHTH